MLVHLLYFLAVVVVLSGLTPGGSVLYPAVLLGQIAVGVGLRQGNLRMARPWLLLIAFALNVLLLAAWVGSEELGANMLLSASAILALLLSSAWSSYLALVSAAAVSLPLIALIHIAVAPYLGQEALAGVRLLVWSLAAWPALALVHPGRQWAIAALVGLPGLPIALHALVGTESGPAQVVWQATVASFFSLDPWISLGQSLLVLCSISPLLLESERRFQYVGVLSVLVFIALCSIVWYSGPWLDGTPWPAYVIGLPATLGMVLGISGMLCTVRRPDLLATTAIRALALGLGIGLSLLQPLSLPQAQRTGEMLPLAARVLSAPLWGCALALFLAGASWVAGKRELPILATAMISRSQVRAAGRLRQSVSGYVSEVARVLVSAGEGRWWRPDALVPLFILASTWPAWRALELHHVPLIVAGITGLLYRDLAYHHLQSWTCIHAALLVLLAWLLGAPWPLGFAAVALALVSAWPFLRWRSADPAWALPAGVVVLSLLLVPMLPGAGGDGLVLALACMILLSNAFLHGPARWIGLPIATASLLLWMIARVPSLDRFVLLIYDQVSPPSETLRALARVGPPLALLCALLASRAWNRQQLRVVSEPYRRPLYVIGLLGAAWWALGLRPSLSLGIPLTLVAMWALWHEREPLRALPAEALRWPLLDAVALIMASTVIAVGRALATWAQLTQRGEAIGGALGLHVLEAGRDAAAVALAVLVIAVIQRGQGWWFWGRSAYQHLRVKRKRIPA